MTNILGENPGKTKSAGRRQGSRQASGLHRISREQFNQRFPKKDILKGRRQEKTAKATGHNASFALPAAVVLKNELAAVEVTTPSRIPVPKRYANNFAHQHTGTQIANGYVDRRRAKWAVAGAVGIAFVGHSLLGGGGTEAPAQSAGSVAIGSATTGAANKARVATPKAETPTQTQAATTIELAAGKIACTTTRTVKVTIASQDKRGDTYSPLAAMERVAGTPQGGDFNYTKLPQPVADAFWNDIRDYNKIPLHSDVKPGQEFQAPVECKTR